MAAIRAELHHAGGWSIGVEMSFYLLVPWMASRLRSPGALLLAILIAAPLACLLAWEAYWASHSGRFTLHSGGLSWPVGNNSFLYLWLPTQMPVFLMGFMAYSLLNLSPAVLGRIRHPRTTSAILLAAAVLVIENVPVGNPPDWPYTFLLSPTLAGLGACALLLSLALHPWRLLVNPATEFLGKISYSLYIVHFIGAWLLAPRVCAYVSGPEAHPLGALATFYLSLAVCLASAIPLALLTRRFIEKPGIAIGKRLINHLESRAKQVAA